MEKIKEIFIKEIEENFIEQLSEESKEYFNYLKNGKKKTPISEKGLNLLSYMQKAYAINDNVFTAKSIGEALGVSGRSVSGSMRKLCEENLVEKISQTPVKYQLTEAGITYSVDL